MDNCTILVTLAALKCKLKAKNKAVAMNKQPVAREERDGQIRRFETEREALTQMGSTVERVEMKYELCRLLWRGKTSY